MFLAIWDSISYELIRFEKKPTLFLTVPYYLGGFPTKIVEKVLVLARFKGARFSSYPKQFKIKQWNHENSKKKFHPYFTMVILDFSSILWFWLEKSNCGLLFIHFIQIISQETWSSVVKFRSSLLRLEDTWPVVEVLGRSLTGRTRGRSSRSQLRRRLRGGTRG